MDSLSPLSSPKPAFARRRASADRERGEVRKAYLRSSQTCVASGVGSLLTTL
jgi:hypothetical protein